MNGTRNCKAVMRVGPEEPDPWKTTRWQPRRDQRRVGEADPARPRRPPVGPYRLRQAEWCQHDPAADHGPGRRPKRGVGGQDRRAPGRVDGPAGRCVRVRASPRKRRRAQARPGDDHDSDSRERNDPPVSFPPGQRVRSGDRGEKCGQDGRCRDQEGRIRRPGSTGGRSPRGSDKARTRSPRGPRSGRRPAAASGSSPRASAGPRGAGARRTRTAGMRR